MRAPCRIGHLSDEVQSSASSNGFPLRVIWVGTSAYQKGLDLAVEACKIARARGQGISLTVVGVPIESAGLGPESQTGWLTWLGPVSPREMDALYRHDLKSYTLIVLNLARDLSRRLRVTDGLLAEFTANVLEEYVQTPATKR